MEIIKWGQLPEQKVYTVMCTNCKTHFKFEQREGTVSYDQRDGNYILISCPLCRKDVYINI